MFKGGKIPDVNSDNMMNIIGSTIVQIVKEQDEYTTKIIEDYVKERQAKGEIISSTIIGEGKLRHVINMGITMLNREINKPTDPKELFPQENYINYLNNVIIKQQQENQRLKNQIKFAELLKGGEEE